MRPRLGAVAANDDQGLNAISLRQLAKELEQNGEQWFRDHYAASFLVLSQGPELPERDFDLKTIKASAPELDQPQARPPDARAIPLIKSDRNGFESKVLVGRALNNDIIIRASEISKVHACFTLDRKGATILQDMGSMNGTMVNGKRLKTKKHIRISTGDWITLWQYIFEYLSLDAMIDRLRASPDRATADRNL